MPEDLLITSKAGERPLRRLDLEPIGPPVAGHCAWCLTRLQPGQNETCSAKCRHAYDSYVTAIGRAVAKRLIVQAMDRKLKPMPKRARRAYSELMRVGRASATWLKHHWQDMEARDD